MWNAPHQLENRNISVAEKVNFEMELEMHCFWRLAQSFLQADLALVFLGARARAQWRSYPPLRPGVYLHLFPSLAPFWTYKASHVWRGEASIQCKLSPKPCSTKQPPFLLLGPTQAPTRSLVIYEEGERGIEEKAQVGPGSRLSPPEQPLTDPWELRCTCKGMV